MHYTTVQLQRTILKSHYSVSASGCQWEVIAFLCEIGLKIMPFNIYICSYGYIYMYVCIFSVVCNSEDQKSTFTKMKSFIIM